MSQLVPPYPSLRVFGEKLASILGSTPDAIYERQRSLVRAGLLELAGRGRKGGTKATPRNIALLLIAFLASDSPVDAGTRAKKLAAMKPFNAPNPYTGESNFLGVLEYMVEHG